MPDPHRQLIQVLMRHGQGQKVFPRLRHNRINGKIKDGATRSKYERLKGNRRRAFSDELSALIEEADFKCFCVVIDKPKVPAKYQAFDPYHISLSRGLRQIETYLKAHAPDELESDLHIVFENRGQDDDAALSRAQAASIITVFCAPCSAARPAIIRAKMRLSLQRFQW